MHMLRPSTRETDVVQAAKNAGALIDLDATKAAHIRKAGIGVVMCLDPRHREEKVESLQVLLECENITPILHIGGPLALDPHLEVVRRYGWDSALIGQIEEARQVTNFAGLYLLAHIPCGLARQHRIGPVQAMESLLRARATVMRNLKFPAQGEPGMLLHYCDGESRIPPAKTRLVCESKMREFFRSYQPLIADAVPA